MKNKKQGGFTLIELLVVIAIIGILASIVLVSLGGARNRARDARIITDMAQIRTASEVYYGNTGAYTGLCSDSSITTLTGDINTQGGTSNCQQSGTAYCVSSPLNASGQYWCVDSTLYSAQSASAPSCTSSDFTCQ